MVIVMLLGLGLVCCPFALPKPVWQRPWVRIILFFVGIYLFSQIGSAVLALI
jgi:hypothetical protein